MSERLKIGDWVKADIIGLGFYEVISIDNFHINFKCLKIFNGKNPDYRNHVTCIHRGSDKTTKKRIKLNHKDWFKRKINRRNIKEI